MEYTNIYTLSDPETFEVRYVGKANSLNERYKNHINKALNKGTHKRNWINSLRDRKLKPIMEVVDIVPVEEWQYWEVYWISQFKTWGFNLINYTEGGDGATFANKTSFKKGHKSWNTGISKIKNKVCVICDKSFKPHTEKQKTCSNICASFIRTGHEDNQFKPGFTPWNKGRSNYKLSGLKESKKVLQFTLDGILIKEHLGCSEAGIAVGCTSCNIRNVCLNKSKTAKGYIWKFKNN